MAKVPVTVVEHHTGKALVPVVKEGHMGKEVVVAEVVVEVVHKVLVVEVHMGLVLEPVLGLVLELVQASVNSSNHMGLLAMETELFVPSFVEYQLVLRSTLSFLLVSPIVHKLVALELGAARSCV